MVILRPEDLASVRYERDIEFYSIITIIKKFFFVFNQSYLKTESCNDDRQLWNSFEKVQPARFN